MFEEKIDVLEELLYSCYPKTFNTLLSDKSTKKNLIWATRDYEMHGYGFQPDHEITPHRIAGIFRAIIQPRISKNIEIQIQRTRLKAEVFTPSWVCNVQNNLVDNIWFGRKNVFNIETKEGWVTNSSKIEFNEDKPWTEYVELRRMEVSCGEAPYLVSRYDNSTGNAIELKDRIGILDRKLRVVNENAKSKEEWLKWARHAVQSVYGYEFQGDNIVIARENILYTYLDNYKYFLNEEPVDNKLKTIANVIAWNIWQMDGLTLKPPFFYKDDGTDQSFNEVGYCRIYDWKANNSFIFKSMIL